MSKTGLSAMLDKRFGFTARGSNVRTEVMAGITTFFAMAYILMVNANMFAHPFATATDLGPNVLGVSYNAVYIATAISAVVGTLCIGLLANLPLAQASGMGLNAFFVYTCVVGMGMTYANALVLVLFDGLLFIVLTVTGLRKKIFNAIPKVVRTAIPAGIGLFIAFLGLQNAGIVVPDSSTGVTLGSFNLLGKSWGDIMPMVVTLGALLAIAIMSHRGVKGAVLIGIVGGTAAYYLLGFLTVPTFAPDITMSNPFTAFKDFFNEALGTVFTDGFDFTAYLNGPVTTAAANLAQAQAGVEAGTVTAEALAAAQAAVDTAVPHSTGDLILTIVTTTLAFCMVDMFDTIGTLYGACARGNMLTKEGEVPNMDKAMLADAIATTTGAICGTSTVTTFVEASSGVAEGGRTGLAAMVTALLFFIAMFLSPIAQLIPGCATAAALVYVGVLMITGVKTINWDDIADAVPAFLTLAMMPFSYNISYGICFGLISHIVIKVCTGKIREVKIGTGVIAAMFLAMLLLTH